MSLKWIASSKKKSGSVAVWQADGCSVLVQSPRFLTPAPSARLNHLFLQVRTMRSFTAKYY